MDRKARTQNKGFIKSIKNAIPAFCSSCGHKYIEKDLTLIQKDKFAATLHLTCSSCKESYLINVVTPLGMLQGSSRTPLKIDLSSAKEAKKFIRKGPISSDDVLNLHEFLMNIKTGEELVSTTKKKS
ncbi:hypothetical protein ACFLY9_02470 [Patescibacteria group bacterium]